MAFDTPTPPFNASDPYARFLSSSCLDLLLIELVPLAERTVQAIDLAPPSGQQQAAVQPRDAAASAAGGGVGGGGGGGGSSIANATSASGQKVDDEDFREALFYRLEGLGYRVGQGLAER